MLVDWTLFRGRHLGQSEVKNLGVSAFGHEDVCRLDVAVDDAGGVSGIERVGDIDRLATAQSQSPEAFRDAVFQCQAIQKLHGDESLSMLVINLVDGADVGMVQRRRGLSFALEAGQRLGIFRNFVRKELQGDEAVQLYVLGLINHTHTAPAEFFDDAVVRDGLADQ